MFKSRGVLIVMVISLVGLTMALFTVQREAGFLRAGQRESLVIAEASQPVFAILYVANALGYFEDELLDVTFQSFTSGRDALESAIKGEADIATTYETPIVINVYEGVHLSVISSLHHSKKNTGIVARKDRGILSPADLRGKKVGVTKNTNADFFLELFLRSEGIELSSITKVDTKPEDMAEMLKSGRVDAVSTWNPNLYNAQNVLPENKLITFYSKLYTEFSVLAGRRDIVLEKSEAVSRLMRAIVRAEEFLNYYPDQSLEIVINTLAEQSPEAIREVWNVFEPTVHLDNVMMVIFNQEAQWFYESGRYVMPVPDFRRVIQEEYLEGIKPEAVTVL